MPLNAAAIVDKCRRLQEKHNQAESRWQVMRLARQGDIASIFPDLVSDDWPKPVIANFIDTVARDLAEMIAPLPAFNCSSVSMVSDAARKAADRRSKIAQNYVTHSHVDTQMYYGADHFVTYGLGVIYIEPDLEAKIPRIVFEDPLGGYPEIDRWGRMVSYTKRFLGDLDDIKVQFPEHALALDIAAGKRTATTSAEIELIRYCDRNQVTLVAVGQDPIVLANAENILGEVPVVIAQRPWLDRATLKGQFDDVLMVQVARNYLAMLQLESTQKAVQAPLALPTDVQEINLGPDAVIRTNTPEKVRRVGLEMSPAGFTLEQVLLQEMREGTRYPQARTGGVEGSIVTGRGVQALMGGLDTQIKSAQQAFKDAFTQAIRLCFMMDEKLWPNDKKNARGSNAGVPYDFAYTPAKDIAGDFSVDVSYGFAAGLDPSRAIVMLLQLRAEKAISRDMFQRQLPFELNVVDEQAKVDLEETREAIKQGIFGYAQSIPAMAQAGMDPAEAIQKVTLIAQGLQKGKKIEELAAEAFAPQRQNTPATTAGELAGGGEGGMGLGPGGNPAGGLTSSGLMKGVSPGQAGMAPGGRPDLSMMLSGLTSGGQPQMAVSTVRRRRV